ncbi:restriction endonuclease subunit S [Limosilactobacillus fermentum]|uniref:restriction endonuclease subunit S n=1 Tax=Limosilactobacillus fermentum TaxID=1613 RepID=UPI00240D32B8|nr:restriction endonuclease subunit S [Limosilactobacillus fermentum]WFA03035.1 restriction endonuclease subunit S [Limosilactobacillus fermentum]
MAKIDDSVKKKVPELRFKGFTDEWEERKLGDLGSVAMNKRIFKEQTSDVGDIPFYKIGTFGGTPDAFISRDLFEEYKSKYQYPEVGDILISASGSIGRTVVYRGADEYFQDSNIVWLKHDSQLVNSFLKQFYSIVKWQGLEGSTIKRLYNKNILETPITLPSPEEQTKLGEFFEKLDNLIAANQRKINLLKEQKKGYLQKMFPKNGEKVPKLRFAGFADDWKDRKLGDITKISTGKLDANAMVENGKYDFYTSGIKKYRIDVAAFEGPSITIAGNGATVGYMHLADNKFNAYQRTYVLQEFLVDRSFIFSEIGNKLPKKIKQEARTGNIPYIVMDMLTELKVSIPQNDTEQKKIGDFFKQLDDTIALHQRKLELLKEQKKGFLQKMFV